MKLETRYQSGKTTIDIFGVVDSYTYPIFAKEINTLVRTGVKKLCIDFSHCPKINVSALKLIEAVSRKIKEREGELIISELKKEEKELLLLMMECNSNKEQIFYD